MTPPSLPSLPGLTWSRHKAPGFSTRVASHVSGREVRVALMNYPLYEFEAVYGGLTSSSANFAGLGASSLQSLMGFFLQLQGQFGTFLYTDPDDNAVSGQAVGVGNGTTQTFILGRTLGGFNEPVGWVTGVTNIYFNGVAQAPAGYIFTAPNSVGFYTAPGAGVTLTADFSYAFQCRFLDDQMDFEEFMSALWKLDGMKFRSVKANITPAASPSWYTPYEISGTPPTLFADFTTEGAGNHYLYNGTTYGGYAALLTALGGTFSRSSAAYYTNSSGVLTQATSGAPRFDYSWNGSTWAPIGLLLEGASTNLLYPSNSASTFPSNYGTTTTASGTGPDGVSTALFIQNGSGTNYFTPYATVSGLSVPATYTFSVFAKAGSAGGWLMMGTTGSSSQGAYFNLNTGTVGGVGSASTASIISFSNGWCRCRVTFVVANSSQSFGIAAVSSNLEGNYGLSNFISASENAFLFGAQLEQLDFASTYIPTTSGAASRAADNLEAATVLSLGTTTTFYADVILEGLPGTSFIASFSDGTSANYADAPARIASGNIVADVVSSSSQVGATTGPSTSAGTEYQIASVVASGAYAMAVNGTGYSGSSAGPPPSSPSKLYLGVAYDGSTDPFFGHIKKFGSWSIMATEFQLEALT